MNALEITWACRERRMPAQCESALHIHGFVYRCTAAAKVYVPANDRAGNPAQYLCEKHASRRHPHRPPPRRSAL